MSMQLDVINLLACRSAPQCTRVLASHQSDAESEEIWSEVAQVSSRQQLSHCRRHLKATFTTSTYQQCMRNAVYQVPCSTAGYVLTAMNHNHTSTTYSSLPTVSINSATRQRELSPPAAAHFTLDHMPIYAYQPLTPSASTLPPHCTFSQANNTHSTLRLSS